jgi:hypothetical protein
MADWHLDELRAALEKRGWSCVELPGNDYEVSATWQLSRPRDARVLHIDFDGLDDMKTLPLEHSYGCNLREAAERDRGLYFRRQRSRELWERELRAFIDSLEP